MGVDCVITLPERTRARDVAQVIGICAGLPAKLKKFDLRDSFYLDVSGIKLQPSSVAECAEITWTDIKSGDERYVMYHFESSQGGRLLLPKSTPFWCAVAVKLVTLFGGTVDFQDCDDVEIDFQASVNPLITATNGDEWNNWQHAMLAIGPLTALDINEGRKVCAYPDTKWTPPKSAKAKA